ncbi:MAG TPA: anthranilate phosphoribosyltransferase [Candidatus Limnocylindrales bacterium]|nr:anthranilate phosphoribosyltransferase [Candidatus Limnocylindrales bacterium]
MIREGIQKLIEGFSLTIDESGEIMREVMSGKATNSQTAAFLTALRMKGEAVEELIAFASVMREHSSQIHPHVPGRLVDTCGTGGDKIKTFNVSTAAAFIVAGAGISVAKHGNRSVTSRSGSADVLEKLGLNLYLEPERVKGMIEKVGIGFMFAPAFHPAMKYAAEPRREIGIRTVFNLLGPLTNPASANAQLLGVYDAKLTSPLAYALSRLGCEEAMVVHGLDGLDEISTVGKTAVAWLKEGGVTEFEVGPSDFGVKQANVADFKVATIEESVETFFRILSGKLAVNDPKMEFTLVNSAAGIIVGGKAEDFKVGMEIAQESIESGAAYSKLKTLISASGGNLSKIEELEAKYE